MITKAYLKAVPNSKRSVADLSETYRDEIKELIDGLGDKEITNPSFNLDTLTLYVKGNHYDKDVESIKKEYYEKGLKDGKEKASIISAPVGGGNSGTAKSGKTNVIKFDDDQNKRMEAMFGTSTMTVEEKRIEYILYYPDQFSESIVKWAKNKDK